MGCKWADFPRVKELAQGGSVTNGATLSSFNTQLLGNVRCLPFTEPLSSVAASRGSGNYPVMALSSHLHSWTGLHCPDLYCIVLDCTALHSTTHHYTALHYTALHCTALHCNTLQWQKKTMPFSNIGYLLKSTNEAIVKTKQCILLFFDGRLASLRQLHGHIGSLPRPWRWPVTCS